jgi:LPXTG-motif cell wall-anchored protein
MGSQSVPEEPESEEEVSVEVAEADEDKDDEEAEVTMLPEAALGGELPQTSGADLILLGLGILVTSGGLVIRRKRT